MQEAKVEQPADPARPVGTYLANAVGDEGVLCPCRAAHGKMASGKIRHA